MVQRHNRLFFILFAAAFPLSAVSAQQRCSARSFKTSGNKQQGPTSYAVCNDLPHLSSAIHYTYDPAASSLDLAFAATPPTPNGWVAWGINPDGPQMLRTQALVAYRGATDGAVKSGTYNVSGYESVVPGKISYKVEGLRAEAADDGRGEIRVFATVKLPNGTTQVNHVWQIGPAVGKGGSLVAHEFKADNMKAAGTLNLLNGQATSSSGSGGAVDSKTRMRNIHGLLNTISWGVLLPMGGIIARHLKVFGTPGSPAWFYIHVTCQIIGYLVGTSGWATGLKLGAESRGVTYSTHRSVGIAVFALGTLQVTALLARPNPNHKYRYLWNALHHTAGYAVIVMGIYNVFAGIGMLGPPHQWKLAYIVIVCAMAIVAIGLEVGSWMIAGSKKYEGKGHITSSEGEQERQLGGDVV